MAGIPGKSFAIDPYNLSGLTLRLWVDSDFTLDSGNNSVCRVLYDQSRAGANLTQTVNGQGPLRVDANGRRSRLIQFSSNNVMQSANAALLALGNGSLKNVTIVDVYQRGAIGTGYSWAWGNTGLANQTLSKSVALNANVNDIFFRATGGNQHVTSTLLDHCCPKVDLTLLDSAGTAQLIDDGDTSQAAVVVTAGTATRDIFRFGQLPNGASAVSDGFDLLRHRLVFEGKASPSQVELLKDWLAPQMGLLGQEWKRNYSQSVNWGNGSGRTKVLVLIGQSNAVGSDPVLYTGNGKNINAWALYEDGNLGVLAEPTVDSTNAPFVHQVTVGSSMARYLCEQARDLGEQDNIIVANVAKGSTTTANWNVNLTTYPPRFSNSAPIGFAKHWIGEACKARNADLFFVMYLGESNAINGAIAPYEAEMNALLNELLSYFSAFVTRTHPVCLVELPVTPATSATLANWNAIRAAQVNIAATRSDTYLVQAPSGPYIAPDNLHLTWQAENALGGLIAPYLVMGT